MCGGLRLGPGGEMMLCQEAAMVAQRLGLQQEIEMVVIALSGCGGGGLGTAEQAEPHGCLPTWGTGYRRGTTEGFASRSSAPAA